MSFDLRGSVFLETKLFALCMALWAGTAAAFDPAHI